MRLRMERVRRFTRYLIPWSSVSSSNALVFGLPIYGVERPAKLQAVIMGIRRFGLWVHNLSWALLHRYHPRHRYNIIPTGLPPGYHDIDERILHGCMTLLAEHVESRGGEDELQAFTDELRDGLHEHQADNQTEQLAIYRWWKYERPLNQQRAEDMMMRLYSSEPVPRHPGDSVDTLHALERQCDDADQAMLHRLINILGSLWT